MRIRLALVLLVLLAVPAVARAQSNTAELLQRAIALYEDNEYERSQVILAQVVSPETPYVVTEPQRVLAFKYLGATLAQQRGAARQDSAVRYFRAALERDPFTDLDPQRFTPIQLQVFGQARAATFAVGVKPVVADTVDPRRETVGFQALTTHEARVRIEIRQGTQVRRVIYDGESNGPRELAWDGLTDDGRLLPPGRYELRLTGESRLITQPGPLRDSARVFFDLHWAHATLEDSLAPLGPQDLLQERHPTSAATADLLRGAAVAGGALLIQTLLPATTLGASRSAAGAVAVAGLGVGIGAFFYRNSHRDIPVNIAENARRRSVRAQENAEVHGRNVVRLRETRLVLAPATGTGQ
jgi:hypothetical protein